MSMQITNPLGAFGVAPTNYSIIQECVAGTGGCVRGDCMVLTWSATTGRVTATKAATDAALAQQFGVAEETASAGEIVKVTVFGNTFVNGGVNTFAVGEAIFRSAATSGHWNRDVPDATTIAGTRAGTVMGVKSAAADSIYPFANAVPVFIEKF